MRPTYTTILFILWLGTIARGQNFYRFRHIGVENGLSQGSIYHIHEDSRGFLWMGTQDGINRFDGKNVQVYLSGATGESTNVQGIAEDSLANLWVGSHKGLYQYVRKKDKFIKPDLKNSLGKVSVHVFSDRKKNIYLLTENGLFRVQNNEIKLLTKEIVYKSSQDNNFLAESPEGDFWFVDAETGLKKFSPSQKKIEYYFSGKSENEFGKPETFSCINFDRTGNLWLGGRSGLIKFDYNGKTTRTYLDKINFEPYILADIVEDHDRLLWLATEGNGIIIFDPHKEKIVQHIRHEDDVTNSLRFNEVSKIYIDANNDVFANSDPQGLDIITAVSSAFSYYTFGKKSLYDLSDYSVRGLAEDSDSSIWIGTELGGINRLEPTSGKIRHYTSQDGLPGNTIRYILKDSADAIWVATSTGLAHFIPKLNRFIKDILPVQCEIITITSIMSGLLLLSTNKGMMLFNTKSKKVIDHSYTNLPGGYASYFDKNSGLVYVSDLHNGVNIFGVTEGKVVLKGRLLENFQVLNIYHQAGSAFLWMCTDRGLIKWEVKRDKLARSYGIAEGIHHEFIYSVLPDYTGHFWLSTNHGLSRFNPATEKFEFIKEILPREYNSRASLITKTGNLYFGSTTGLDRIKPSLLSLRNDRVGVHLTDINIDPPTSVNDSVNIDEIFDLKLPFTNNTISLTFTATDYRSGGLNRYRYFLKGYDKDTIYSGNVDQVRYARLPAGKYEFQLQASDLGGNWVSPVRKLAIQILPPFWMTWWFVLISVFFIASFIFILVKAYLNYRLTAQKLESGKEIFLEKERSRIARDINDSLGSELFGLKLLGQVALARNNREDTESYLQKIVEVSKGISEKISEVIWVTDSDQDNVESLWSYIQKNALIYLKPSGIEYHFENISENQVSNISGERRHEILNFHKQLFMELTKACDFDQCKLFFSIYSNYLVISIENAGLDLTEESLMLNLQKLKGNIITSSASMTVFEILLSD